MNELLRGVEKDVTDGKVHCHKNAIDNENIIAKAKNGEREEPIKATKKNLKNRKELLALQ